FMMFMNLSADPVQAAALQNRIIDRLNQAQEIQVVALVDRFPYGGTWTPPVSAGAPIDPAEKRSFRTLANLVSGSYFRTMGIPIQRGRTFTTAEANGNQPVAVVSETAARRLWPHEDPIGKQLSLDMDFRGHLAEFEVVGV